MSSLSLKDAKGVTKEQLEFIEYDIKNDSIILISTAGSGKSFSAIHRMKYLLEKGIDPKRIIFFSFTVAAVEELKNRVQNDDIKITTIHSFCMSLLGKMGKFKKICTFYDFINWFKEKHKPKSSASSHDKDKFYSEVEKLYDESEYLSSEIAAYKLQTADNIKTKFPDYLKEYQKFMKENKARDFSDMLIETRDCLKQDKWLKMFRNQYDYVFVDEYQDTSTIMFQILLSLNAKHYYLMGDRAQSIYGYSGANCLSIESMLKKRRKTVELNLSTNFRSNKLIVENSNLHTDLKAIPYHKEDGVVHKKVIFFEDVVKLFSAHEEVVVLVRTNDVIKQLEKRLMLMRVPIRYFNYITKSEIEDLKKGSERYSTQKKINSLLAEFGTVDKIVEFIEDNANKRSFITTVHKSKGREFEICVVTNSIAPDVIEYNEMILNPEQTKAISFDPHDPEDFESKNVHYVAVSRAKKEIYFMIFGV